MSLDKRFFIPQSIDIPPYFTLLDAGLRLRKPRPRRDTRHVVLVKGTALIGPPPVIERQNGSKLPGLCLPVFNLIQESIQVNMSISFGCFDKTAWYESSITICIYFVKHANVQSVCIIIPQATDRYALMVP